MCNGYYNFKREKHNNDFSNLSSEKIRENLKINNFFEYLKKNGTPIPKPIGPFTWDDLNDDDIDPREVY